MRENVMMIAGGGCKKSFIMKKLMKALTNSTCDRSFPGIKEILREAGLFRKAQEKDCDMCKMHSGMDGGVCGEVGAADLRDRGLRAIMRSMRKLRTWTIRASAYHW